MAAVNASSNICTLLNAGQQTLGFRKMLLRSAQHADRVIAHLPGATHEALIAAGVDPQPIKQRNMALARGLLLGRELAVTTRDEQGRAYRLALDLGGWACPPMLNEASIARGTWGNLPGGEIYLAPLAAEGELLVDGSIDNLVLDKPLLCRFEEDRLIGIEPEDSVGGRYLRDLREQCNKNNDGSWNRVSEVGIGTNGAIARFGISTLLNEKMLGTCHIGLGHNKELGGDQESLVQIKLFCRSPCIEIDGVSWLMDSRHVYDLNDPGEDHAEIQPADDYQSWRITKTGYPAVLDRDRLYRVWFSDANGKHRLQVGRRETARKAARVFRALSGRGEHSVAGLAATTKLDPVVVAQLLILMQRYDLIAIGR